MLVGGLGIAVVGSRSIFHEAQKRTHTNMKDVYNLLSARQFDIIIVYNIHQSQLLLSERLITMGPRSPQFADSIYKAFVSVLGGTTVLAGLWLGGTMVAGFARSSKVISKRRVLPYSYHIPFSHDSHSAPSPYCLLLM